MVHVLKFLLVLASLVSGAFFLAIGLGIAIPVINYKGFVAYNLPAGAVLLAIGILLAVFWKVTTTETTIQKPGKYGLRITTRRTRSFR
jgi:hypothetical protein